jgi:hypothetical protein
MTREEVMEMAYESGVIGGYEGEPDLLERFAKLVAAAAKEEMLMAGNDQWLEEARKAEREACAKLAASKASVGNASNYPTYIAAAIRARGNP